MADSTLDISPTLSKADFYSELCGQLEVILEGETDAVARMSTIAAALGSLGKYLWAGFYIVRGEELVLGPFNGPLACFRIAKGRGVCGQAWEQNENLLVPNVHEFTGHIACSSASNSEIVIPLRRKTGEVWAVLDVDHVMINGLDEADLRGLTKLALLVTI